MQAKELHGDKKPKENHGKTIAKEVLFFLPDPYPASRGKSLTEYRGQ
jgi:hypothetical protein